MFFISKMQFLFHLSYLFLYNVVMGLGKFLISDLILSVFQLKDVIFNVFDLHFSSFLYNVVVGLWEIAAFFCFLV